MKTNGMIETHACIYIELVVNINSKTIVHLKNKG